MIIKACIYNDGRCHGAFDDGSGIILHRGGQYLSYFSPAGEITRQVSLCTAGGVKSKLCKLINLYNSSCFSPVSVFSEDIYKVLSQEQKITSCSFLNPGAIQLISSESESEGSTVIYNKSSEKIGLVEEDKNGSIKVKSIEGDVTVALNKHRNLLKVTYPYLLPHRKPSWSEGQNNRVRLRYEYVQLSQVFHVMIYPPEWQVALNILLAASGNSVEPLEEEETKVMIPAGVKGEIWSNDSISPAVNLFSYLNDNLYYYWEPEASYYVTSPRTCTVLVHEDQSFLECSGDFFTHIREDKVLKFTTDTVPVTTKNANYKLSHFVRQAKEFQKIPVVIKSDTNAEELEDELMDGVKVENEVEGLGAFTAYNDKSIRVLFSDRTLIRIYNDFSVSAISRTGEAARFNLDNPFGFEQYIPVCVEFYNWAFLTQTEQVKRANETAEREAIVMAEISKVERLSNQIPQLTPSVPLDDSVSQSLLNAKKQLEETKELLNRLNRIN